NLLLLLIFVFSVLFCFLFHSVDGIDRSEFYFQSRYLAVVFCRKTLVFYSVLTSIQSFPQHFDFVPVFARIIVFVVGYRVDKMVICSQDIVLVYPIKVAVVSNRYRREERTSQVLYSPVGISAFAIRHYLIPKVVISLRRRIYLLLVLLLYLFVVTDGAKLYFGLISLFSCGIFDFIPSGR